MIHQIGAINIVWSPDKSDKAVEEEINLAVEFKYFADAWLAGKLSSSDFLEYAEWRGVDMNSILSHWEKLGRFEL